MIRQRLTHINYINIKVQTIKVTKQQHNNHTVLPNKRTVLIYEIMMFWKSLEHPGVSYTRACPLIRFVKDTPHLLSTYDLKCIIPGPNYMCHYLCVSLYSMLKAILVSTVKQENLTKVTFHR